MEPVTKPEVSKDVQTNLNPIPEVWLMLRTLRGKQLGGAGEQRGWGGTYSSLTSHTGQWASAGTSSCVITNCRNFYQLLTLIRRRKNYWPLIADGSIIQRGVRWPRLLPTKDPMSVNIRNQPKLHSNHFLIWFGDMALFKFVYITYLVVELPLIRLYISI